MPSGSFRPSLTITFRSEPSGFAVNTRPPLRSKKNRRPVVAVGMDLVGLGFAVVDIEFTYSFSEISNEYNRMYCNGLATSSKVVITLPFNEIPMSNESAVCQWFSNCQRTGRATAFMGAHAQALHLLVPWHLSTRTANSRCKRVQRI